MKMTFEVDFNYLPGDKSDPMSEASVEFEEIRMERRPLNINHNNVRVLENVLMHVVQNNQGE